MQIYSSAQVFTDGCDFDHFYPMQLKSKAGLILAKYIRDTRMIPEYLSLTVRKKKRATNGQRFKKDSTLGKSLLCHIAHGKIVPSIASRNSKN